MSKTIIINESMLESQALKEDILLTKLPSDISGALSSHETSLGNSEAFPYSDFDKKIAVKRFNEVIDNLKEIRSIDDVEDTKIQGAFETLYKRCQKLEQNDSQALESLALSFIQRLFNIPKDTIDISVNLIGDIKKSKLKYTVNPTETDDFEFDDVDEIGASSQAIAKRRIIDALIMGGAMRLGHINDKFSEEIYNINPKLPDLYHKIMCLNDYLLFTKNDLDITDKNPRQIGLTNVNIIDNNNLVTIASEGEILPVLIIEMVRGLLELFASHGLPEDKEMAEYVIKEADCLIYEPWDMRMGPALWDRFMDAAQNPNVKKIPYIFTKYCELSFDDFFNITKEIFGKTKKAKVLMGELIKSVDSDVEYADFKARMQSKQQDTHMIVDQQYNE